MRPEESESEIMQASEDDAPKDTALPECPLRSISAPWYGVWVLRLEPLIFGCPTNEVSNVIQEFLKVDGVKTGLQSTHSNLPSTGNNTVKVASICSGLGIADMVFDQLNPALREPLDPIPALKA